MQHGPQVGPHLLHLVFFRHVHHHGADAFFLRLPFFHLAFIRIDELIHHIAARPVFIFDEQVFKILTHLLQLRRQVFGEIGRHGDHIIQIFQNILRGRAERVALISREIKSYEELFRDEVDHNEYAGKNQ